MKDSEQRPLEADLVIKGAGDLITCPRDGSLQGAAEKAGLIEGGAVAARQGRIVWVGETSALARSVRLVEGGNEVDADGRMVMPGLIECHAHIAWAGDRADEYQARLAGATIQELTAGGGGIISTVEATRAATDEELRAITRRRLDHFLRFGVTTVEAKSGYGLTVDQEVRLLEAYRDVNVAHPVDVVSTLLAADTVPLEYKGQTDEYLNMIIKKLIPYVAKHRLARFCDAFCEEGSFSRDQCRRVLKAGMDEGLLPKLHGDQHSDMGAAELAVELGAVSVDHLERISDAGIGALSSGGGDKRKPVAVLLPGARFFLGEGDQAPARRLLDAGVRVALSTDLNPGSSPTENLWLMATMGCSQLRMTAEEVVRAITIEAAAALALEDEVGSLEVGKKADILILDSQRYVQIPYRYGMNPVWRVFKDGQLVVKRDLANRL